MKLKDICTLINGRAFKPNEWASEGLPIIRIQNLNNEHADFNYCNFKVDEKYLVDNGQLLFAWSGTPGTSFGAHIWKRGKAVLNQHIFKVQVDETCLDKTYLMHLLNRNVDEYIRKAHGTAGLAHITKGKFENSFIPLPPLPTQKLIVAEIEKQFSRLDEAVAALRRVQANLKRYKASVLKAAVEGRLTEEWQKDNVPSESGADLLKRILAERRRKWEEDYVNKYIWAHGHAPKDDSWKKKYKEPANIDEGILTDIPVKWKWASAEAVCSSVRDGTHDTPKYLNEGIPLVTSKNLLPSGLDFGNINYISVEDHFEISKRSAVDEDDILFAMIGTIGNPVVVKTSKPFSIKNVGLFKKNADYVLPEYLKIWLVSPVFGEWLKPRLKGTTQKFAPLGLLRSLAVPLPPTAEQDSIVSEVNRRLSVAEEIEAVIETNLKRAERMRQAILKKAFEGRLV